VPPPPRRAAAAADAVAPDGSEIRFLAGAADLATRSSLVEVDLPADRVTIPVRHRTVEETWYVVEGSGEVWRVDPDGDQATFAVAAGDSLVIPTGWGFQFAAGPQGLRFICFTSPAWPGPEEAMALAEGGLGPPLLGERNPRS